MLRLKSKKLLSLIGATALVMTFSISAFAGSSSKYVSGYGTLYGSLDGNGDYVTSVSNNPDRAKLTIKGLIEDRNGRNVSTQQEIKSGRGATDFSGQWSRIPSNAYALFGTHGVQEGGTYGANLVYTYSRANT